MFCDFGHILATYIGQIGVRASSVRAASVYVPSKDRKTLNALAPVPAPRDSGTRSLAVCAQWRGMNKLAAVPAWRRETALAATPAVDRSWNENPDGSICS